MNTMTLKTIKWESVKSIFNSIACADQISRAKIAEETGLSLVTVGKVADALLDMDIITQEKQIKVTAGRRAGILTINKEKFVLILDLSSKIFRFSVLDLNLGLVEKARHNYQTDRFLDENIRLFFSETAIHMNRFYNMDNCFGIGVSLPGPYDPETDTTDASRIPDFKNLHIRALVEEYFAGHPVCLDACANVAALSNITAIPDYGSKNVLYWFLGEENTTGSLLINGSFLHGSKLQPCDFGQLVLPGGNKLGMALRRCKTPEELVSVIAYPLHTIIQILAPNTIILECEWMREDRERVVPLVQQALHEQYDYRMDYLPDFLITHCRFRHSHRGLAIRLREMWIDRMLLND